MSRQAFHSMSAANREIRKRKKLDENMDLGDYDFEVDSDVNDENGGESKDEGIAIGGENDLTAQRALAAKGKNKKRGPKKSLREMVHGPSIYRTPGTLLIFFFCFHAD